MRAFNSQNYQSRKNWSKRGIRGWRFARAVPRTSIFEADLTNYLRYGFVVVFGE